MKKLILIVLACVFSLSIYSIGTKIEAVSVDSSQQVTTLPKPINVALKDLSTKTLTRTLLTWASGNKTVQIDGYSIYRKVDDDAVNSKIGSVDSVTFRFEDDGKFETDATYTYLVRSYLGSQESVDSSSETFTPKGLTTQEDAKALTATSNTQELNNLPVNQVLIFVALLLLLITAVLFIFRKGLMKKAPYLYKNIVDTSLKSIGGKVVAIILGLLVIAILIVLYLTFTQGNYSVFIG